MLYFYLAVTAVFLIGQLCLIDCSSLKQWLIAITIAILWPIIILMGILSIILLKVAHENEKRKGY